MTDSRVQENLQAGPPDASAEAVAGAWRHRLVALAAFGALALAALALWARHGSTLFVDMLAIVTSCF